MLDGEQIDNWRKPVRSPVHCIHCQDKGYISTIDGDGNVDREPCLDCYGTSAAEIRHQDHDHQSHRHHDSRSKFG